jgi:hypothetical protein
MNKREKKEAPTTIGENEQRTKKRNNARRSRV